MKQTAFGYGDSSFYGLELEPFDRKGLRDAGYSDTSAYNLLERLRKNPEFPEKKTRADSYKSPKQSERNMIVAQFLEEDHVSTVSDRASDQRIVDGQLVTLRFLERSIKATHELLSDQTGLVISESVFRQLLVKNKHIKHGRRERKTACCKENG